MVMNADGSQLLEQLRDIHSAGQPGWWPPAPGWWVLAFIFLLVLGLLLRKFLHWLSIRRRRQTWLRELEALNREHDPSQHPREYLAGLNRLFRAVAVRAFPGTACGRLQGEPWVAWIKALLPERADSDSLNALASGPYEPAPGFDALTLNEMARTWVKLYG
jgi:hypothetical protein